jgi:hypothetical protein
VADGDLRSQQRDRPALVDAVDEIEVLRRLERPPAAEHLVEVAHLVEQPPPGGEVGAHPEDLEAFLLAHPLRMIDRDHRRQVIPRALLERHDLPVEEVAVRLVRERGDDRRDPIGRHDAVVVGEHEDLTRGRLDPGVVRPRQPGLGDVEVRQPRVVGGDRPEHLSRRVVGALVDDDHVERDVVVREHGLDRLTDALAAVPGAHHGRDRDRARAVRGGHAPPPLSLGSAGDRVTAAGRCWGVDVANVGQCKCPEQFGRDPFERSARWRVVLRRRRLLAEVLGGEPSSRPAR